jgi:DNA-binding CsgD family transcriptional regulator
VNPCTHRHDMRTEHMLVGPNGPGLLGRDRELAALEAVVAGADPDGTALLLRGDPGVGKTALLGRAAELARRAGRRVLRSVGVEPEREMAFAVLHQALYPLLDDTSALPPAQRAAVERAFGFRDGSPPDPFAVCAAVRVLLRDAARRQPLLVVVDDLQWIDASSARVWEFVRHRLVGLPLVLLASLRTGYDSPVDLAGTGVLDIACLSPSGSADLLAHGHPDLAVSTAARVLRDAGGLPLALLELPGQLTDEQRSGAQALPDPLPLGPALERVFVGRIRSLPEVVRHTLLLAALCVPGPARLRTVRAAAQASWPGRSAEALDSAQASGLVTVDLRLDHMVFRHPLLRSALVGLASPTQLHQAHQALAQASADDPERRAWHLAAAAMGLDDSLAAALGVAARYAVRRGAATEATGALVRAAEFTTSAETRGRLLIEAALIGVDGGRLDLARRLLARLDVEEPGPGLVVRRATAQAFAVLHADGEVRGTYRVLARLIEQVPVGEQHDGDFEDAFSALLLTCFWLGRQDLWEPLERVLDRAPESARLCFDAVADPARTAHTVRDRLDHVTSALPRDPRSRQTNRLIWTAMYTDTVADHSQLWNHVPENGLLTSRLLLLMARSYDAYLHGAWDEAESLAREGVEQADAHGYRLFVHLLGYAPALVAADRGDEETARRIHQDTLAWAQPRGMRQVVHAATEALIHLAVGRGDHEEAYTRAAAMTPPGEIPSYVAHFHRVFLDLVDAAMGTGRVAEARAHVAAGRAARMDRISPHHALILAAAVAMTADPDRADRLFREAIGLPGADQWPFDLARVHLGYGTWLRRRRKRDAAATHLDRALDTFLMLRATPWVERARAELRACGRQSPGPDPALEQGWSSLNPQEARVAELAAQGMTNKEIGQVMHLSPRTVGGHLYKVFPKLGIVSRAALRDRLPHAGDLPADLPVGLSA